MRPVATGIAILLVTTTALAAQAGQPLHLHREVEHAGDVDLHALCEELARDCWDLDPADYGMTPVTAELPPLPEGTIITVEGSENVQVKASLLGKNIHIHGTVAFDQSGSYDAEQDDDQPAVPCSDERGCPDLRVDLAEMTTSIVRSRETFPADHCAVQEGSTEPGFRTLMRFSFKSPNTGLGDLVIGDPDDHHEWFEWGDCHGHWHFREYADYRLWTPEGYAAWRTLRTAYPHAEPGEILNAFPELRDHFRAGHKQGFCVIDLIPPTVSLGPGTYTDCADNQGISVGWADMYHRWLDGQWVDVTGLPSGPYILEAEVNPERFFEETNYGNNDSAVRVQV